MNTAEQYAKRIEAVGAQRTRTTGGHPLQHDRWVGPLAKRFRADPRRELDPALTLIASYLQPDDVFLDVGGGAGRVALPLALRCREAIVVDPSAGMKQEFDELVAESGITNARYLQEAWPAPGGLTGDVVFAAHVTYFVRDIQPFIQAMHDAARRRVAILIGSVPPPALNAKLYQLVYNEEQALVPGKAELLPVLWDMGFVPEMRVLGGAFAVMQPPTHDRDESIRRALFSVEAVERPGARQTVEAHFDELFADTPNGYVPTWMPDAKTLLITWEK